MTKRLKCPPGSRKDTKRQNRCFTPEGVEKFRTETTPEVVRRYFPNIINDDYEYKLACIDDDSSTLFSIDDVIHISWISKCGDVKGSDILNRIINLAKKLKKPIQLHDVSNVEIGDCKYSLSSFFILLTGESWYNKFKFKSINHSEDVKWNKKIRKLPLRNFIDQATTEYVKKNMQSFQSMHEALLELDSEYKRTKSVSYLTENNWPGFDIEIIKQDNLKSYLDSKIKEITDHRLLNLNDFVKTYKYLGIDETTPVYIIVKKIYEDFMNPKCDKKIHLLEQLIESSYHVLHYNKHLTRR